MIKVPAQNEGHLLFEVNSITGVNLVDEQSLIGDDECSLIQNRWAESRNVWTNRSGMTKFNAAVISATAERITAMGTFYKADGTISKVIVCVKDGTAGKIYSANLTAPVFAEITGATALTHSEEWSILQWQDTVYISNGIEKIQTTVNGTTRLDIVTNGAGTDSRGKYLVVWKDRLVVSGLVSDPSIVAFSNSLDPTIFAAGNKIYVGQNDGTKITALILAGVTTNIQSPQAELLILKESSTWTFSGEIYGAYSTLNQISNITGCTGNKSFCYTPIGPIWTSKDGVYSSMGTGAPQRIDDKVRSLFSGEGPRYTPPINTNLSYNTAMIYHNLAGHMKMSYTITGDTFNTRQLWLDLRKLPNVSWSGVHIGQSISSWIELKDGTLLGGGANTGFVYTMDNGLTDDGTAISDLMITKAYDFGMSGVRKVFRKWQVDFDAYLNSSVTIELNVDDSISTSSTQNITPVGDLYDTAVYDSARYAGSQSLRFHKGNLPTGFTGYYMYLKISCTASSGSNELISILLQFTPKGRFIFL